MREVVKVVQFGPVAYGFAVADREETDAGAAPLGEDLGLPRSARARQVHGAVALEATDPWEEWPDADALVTSAPGLGVAVVTADCVPLLLWDSDGTVVAAVHAGWRGAASGVVEAALDRVASVADRSPAGLHALIGPSAGGCCYEVGAEVVTLLRREVYPGSWLKARPEGRPHIDLGEWVESCLRGNGVRQIERWGGCTICSSYWPSYRRLGAGCGRIISMIGLP